MSNLSYFDENNHLFNSSSEKFVYFLNNQVTEAASNFKFKPIKLKLSLLEEDNDDDDEDMQYYYYDETNRHTIYNSENSNSKSIEQVNILPSKVEIILIWF